MAAGMLVMVYLTPCSLLPPKTWELPSISWHHVQPRERVKPHLQGYTDCIRHKVMIRMEYGEGEDAQGQGAGATGKVPTAYTNISEKRVQQSQDAQALGPPL